MGDLGEILAVEQAHLQGPVVSGEFGDHWCAQRGDPAETGCGVVVEFAQRGDARGSDHAAIPDEHQFFEPEPLADHRDDLGERGRVGGGTGEHAHRHRPALGVGEDAVFDLLAALFAVAGVAAGDRHDPNRSHQTPIKSEEPESSPPGADPSCA
nr:hypothetical protein [Mycobacterium riyadhense]